MKMVKTVKIYSFTPVYFHIYLDIPYIHTRLKTQNEMIVTFKYHLRQIFILTRTVENKNMVVGKPQKMILFIISTYSEGLR